MNIYIGNLSREITEDDLKNEFRRFGEVSKVSIIKDRITGEKRGFGFLEMPSSEQAQAAITGLNRRELRGKRLIVNEAKPKAEREAAAPRGIIRPA